MQVPTLDGKRVTLRPLSEEDVEQLRRYERGADGRWHDNLLMELMAEELR